MTQNYNRHSATLLLKYQIEKQTILFINIFAEICNHTYFKTFFNNTLFLAIKSIIFVYKYYYYANTLSN